MAAEELVELELMRNRFNRLIAELLRGAIVRTTFQPWEIGLLLDIEACGLREKERPEILKRYRRTVDKQLDTGPGPPMKLSEFLQRRMTRRSSTT